MLRPLPLFPFLLFISLWCSSQRQQRYPASGGQCCQCLGGQSELLQSSLAESAEVVQAQLMEEMKGREEEAEGQMHAEQELAGGTFQIFTEFVLHVEHV